MDMNALFEDYMQYLNSMDTGAVLRSIRAAEAHTSDSQLIDDALEHPVCRSAMQTVSPIIGMHGFFSFCSIGAAACTKSYDFVPMEVDVA